MVNNPNWQEADQLAIYKRGRGVELWATEKQLLLAVRAGLEPVRRPNLLDHAASQFHNVQFQRISIPPPPPPRKVFCFAPPSYEEIPV